MVEREDSHINNWWIAALENAGIWTREQAEHVSNEMRKQIHSDRYVDAYETLKSVLEQGKFTDLPVVSKLETDVHDLQASPVIENMQKVIADLQEEVKSLKKTPVVDVKPKKKLQSAKA